MVGTLTIADSQGYLLETGRGLWVYRVWYLLIILTRYPLPKS